MTENQKTALRMMYEGNIGALFIGEWIWPEDIRNDEKKAEAVVIRLQARIGK